MWGKLKWARWHPGDFPLKKVLPAFSHVPVKT